jgi:hypothetical protein
MENEVIERTFPVTGKASLKLSNISGSVILQPGQADQIVVKATKLANTGSMDRTEIEMEQKEDGQVKVSTRFPEGFLGFLGLNSPCDVNYEVTLPPECDVHATGVSSSVEARGLSGSLEFSAVSGDLSLKDLSGSVSASTVSGNLDGQEIRAGLRLKSVSGDIGLEGSFASVEANTVSGNIELDSAELGEGPYHFKSVSGDFHLQVQKEASFRLEHKSISGDILTNLPVSKSSRQPGSQRVEIGSGDLLITSSSVSGNLKVSGPDGEVRHVRAEKAHEAHHNPSPPPPAAVPEAPHNPAPLSSESLTSDERQAILDKIASGELSVEEALEKLTPK